jgi:tight adherence protein B
MSETIFIVAVALCALLAVGGVAFVLLGAGGNQTARRVAAVTAGRRAAGKAADAAADNNAQRRKNVQDTLKELERKQQATKVRLTTSQLIEQAGWTTPVKTFWTISAVMALVVSGIMMLMQYSIFIALLAGFAAGLGLPRWWLNFRIAARKKAFVREFANAIDVIVRGVKSGLPLNECLKVIANEAAAPVGPEFRNLIENMKIGVTLEDALKKLYDRMQTPEVNFFQIVLSIQAKTGGNLSEALGNLSGVLRDRKRLHGKIQALSSEAKASALIIGSLPVVVMLLVYLTTPTYIELLFTERLGNIMLMGCAFWMSIGVLIMKKMINFKY